MATISKHTIQSTINTEEWNALRELAVRSGKSVNELVSSIVSKELENRGHSTPAAARTVVKSRAANLAQLNDATNVQPEAIYRKPVQRAFIGNKYHDPDPVKRALMNRERLERISRGY